jgi:hypothetical protein
MKFPKNRANLYLVIRDDHSQSVCGGFSEPDAAGEFASACEQEWRDKYPHWEGVPKFKVTLTTFYG